MDAPADTPGVVARPPILFLGALLLGAVLQLFFPLPLIPGLPAAARVLLGGAAILGAVGLVGAAVRALRGAGTPIPASEPTTALVTAGPCARSRNPIYLAFTLLQLGLAIAGNTAWLVLTLVPTLLIVRYGVIAREEAYLERKFGPAYAQYRRTVPRWLNPRRGR
jgi:protein-S-isoprenylcysteine O-methyltransferase Ste14